MAAISAQNLSLTFQTADGLVHALSDVDLTVERGEFVSFIGPSGCGKTTFLRVIADLERPTSGKIAVNGMTPEEARKLRAYGYVFQAPALYPWRTVQRNIALPLEIMGVSKEERRERIARLLDLVDLAGFDKKFPWQLSGGMQQRASIARALVFDADLLLMDEPFGALDEQTRLLLGDKLLEIWSALKQTMLLITHNITEAVQLSDRVVVMTFRPGRIKEEIKIDLPRPRSSDAIAAAEFGRYVGQIWNLLRDEATRGMRESERRLAAR
jgi:NitT/TauT family transport system ATP-binding protein